jgi:hypothetical protein
VWKAGGRCTDVKTRCAERGGGWGWIQVRSGDRKKHGRRLYQQLLLASELHVCVCVCVCVRARECVCVCDFAFLYTPSLRSVVARVFFCAITSEGIRDSSGGNTCDIECYRNFYIGISETSDSR